MKLEFEGGHTTIGDDSEEAIKIKEGYDYTFDEKGNIKIGKKPAEPNNKYQIENSIKDATTLDELKDLIIKLINL